ncbi:MAG: ribose 5-phosphate isomerase B [Clostridiales bacterium]|nr:ribose 5-phosphate isomerase B [Clostridiales bacterium]
MVISIASDHAGYELRQAIVSHLEQKGHQVLDRGALSSKEPYSYVQAGRLVAKDLSEGSAERGIAICGTGIGISIVCNKKRGIRCALCLNECMARLARQHNDANILAMGARVVGVSLAESMVDTFLSETFDGGRHRERVDDIE